MRASSPGSEGLAPQKEKTPHWANRGVGYTNERIFSQRLG